MRAIADPVRRDILELLCDGPQPAGAVAAAFDGISRPAVSRHLRVLREHGLVRDELVGRARIYRAELAPLLEVEAWLVALRSRGVEASADPGATWSGRLDALETEVRRTGRDRRHGPALAAPVPEPEEHTA